MVIDYLLQQYRIHWKEIANSSTLLAIMCTYSRLAYTNSAYCTTLSLTMHGMMDKTSFTVDRPPYLSIMSTSAPDIRRVQICQYDGNDGGLQSL